MITRKQWNRKTTLYQYLSVFDRITKQIILPDTSKITFFCEMGLFTLHKCCVSWLMNFLKLNLILKIFLLFLSFLVNTVCCLTPCSFFYITQKVLVWGCWNFLTFPKYPKPSLHIGVITILNTFKLKEFVVFLKICWILAICLNVV